MGFVKAWSLSSAQFSPPTRYPHLCSFCRTFITGRIWFRVTDRTGPVRRHLSITSIATPQQFCSIVFAVFFWRDTFHLWRPRINSVDLLDVWIAGQRWQLDFLPDRLRSRFRTLGREKEGDWVDRSQRNRLAKTPGEESDWLELFMGVLVREVVRVFIDPPSLRTEPC